MKSCLFILSVAAVMCSEGFAQRPLRLSLDETWLFRPDSLKVGVREGWFADTADRAVWTPVSTPSYWESYPGMAQYDGWGWYARTIDLPHLPGQMSLYFAGVDDEAVVWVNGVEAGEHSGYGDPFFLDLPSCLREGANTIVVLVKDNAGGGGIYRPVTLIETAALPELLRGPLYGTPALRSVDWVREAVIYSVYLRSFSPEGTFAGLERR